MNQKKQNILSKKKEVFTAALDNYFNAIKRVVSDELSKKQPDFEKIDEITGIANTEKADFIKLGEALETIQELQKQLSNSKESVQYNLKKYDEAKETIEENLKESKRVEDLYKQKIISVQTKLSETQKTVDEQNNKFKKIKELPLVRKKIKDIIDR